MISQSILRTCREPWLLKSRPRREEYDLPEGYIRVHLDGRRMNSFPKSHREIASLLHFPEYYGFNIHALSECLADLEWLPALGYLITIGTAENVLADGSDDALNALLSLFSRIGHERSVPIALGEHWDRPAVPFHTVLEPSDTEYDNYTKKLERINLSVAEIA